MIHYTLLDQRTDILPTSNKHILLHLSRRAKQPPSLVPLLPNNLNSTLINHPPALDCYSENKTFDYNSNPLTPLSSPLSYHPGLRNPNSRDQIIEREPKQSKGGAELYPQPVCLPDMIRRRPGGGARTVSYPSMIILPPQYQ